MLLRLSTRLVGFQCKASTIQNATLSAPKTITGLLSNDLSTRRAFSNSPNSTLNEYQNFSRLKVNEPAKHVINVQLNRPDKLNAVDTTMFKEIKDCFTKLHRDRYFRSIILSATGRVFCAGIDLQSFQSLLSDESRESSDIARKSLEIRNLIHDVQDCVLSVGQCQKPVIAAIHSKCIGAGIDIVSFTDIRYCTKDAAFCVKEVALGLAPDIGSLQGLPRIVGNQSFVREMVFTAKEVYSEEAKEMGLVSKVCEDATALFDSAVTVAELIAKKSPIAVQGSKIILDYSKDHATWDSLRYNANWNMSMLQSEDLLKATLATISKKDDVEFNDL